MRNFNTEYTLHDVLAKISIYLYWNINILGGYDYWYFISIGKKYYNKITKNDGIVY